MRRIDTITRRRIMQLYVDDLSSMDAIGAVVGCSRPTVQRILTEAGIVCRPPGVPTPATLADAPDVPTIIARYQAGESMARLARDLNHHGQTIRRVLTQAGVPIRANGGITAHQATAEPRATHPTPWYAVHGETRSPCPGCGAPRCLNVFCCGRRLRAQAQHRTRLEGCTMTPETTYHPDTIAALRSLDATTIVAWMQQTYHYVPSTITTDFWRSVHRARTRCTALTDDERAHSQQFLRDTAGGYDQPKEPR